MLSMISFNINSIILNVKMKEFTKLVSILKKYFTNSDILHYGLITVIHTFGRDLKWNPHIHAIVTLGGFNKNHKYLEKKYFHVNSIAGQWKKLVIDIVKNGNYENEKLKKRAYHVASQLYHKNTRFFFDVAKLVDTYLGLLSLNIKLLIILMETLLSIMKTLLITKKE